MSSHGAGGGPAAGAGNQNTGAQGGQQGGQRGGGQQGAGAARGGSGSRATAAVAYMSRIIGTMCHGVRAPSSQAARVQGVLLNAKQELDTWRQERPNVDVAAFQAKIDAIIDRTSGALDPSLGAARERAKAEKEAQALLEEIRKQRPIVLPDGTELSPQILGSDYQDLSADQRKFREQALRNKIERGRALMQRLKDPNFDPNRPPAPTRRDISDLAFYLRVQSEKVAGAPWMRGALSFPDPEGKIRRWLDGAEGHVYTRLSSHLKPDQAAGGHQGRGVDFDTKGPFGERLPYGMRTLLFQQFTRDGQDYLYFKMETEGARLNPGAYWKRQHDGSPDPNTFRPLESADVSESLRHLYNLIVPEKDTSGLDRHGEKLSDLPKNLRRSYQMLVDVTKNDPALFAAVTEGGKTKWWSSTKLEDMPVSQMQANIDRLNAVINDPSVSDETREAVNWAANQWRNTAENTWGPDYAQDVPVRVGDEVVLRPEDLT